jgi:hypothetical protein
VSTKSFNISEDSGILYNNIIVDVFNMIWRLRGKAKKVTTVVKNCIDHIENDIKAHLDSKGTLYLLLDPIPLNDLGMSKAFGLSTRQKILSDYKMNRPKDPLILEVASFLKKYYAFRGASTVLLYSDEYEADDFVQPLIERCNGRTALLSTDLDWSRSICADVDLINTHWDTPFTANEFEMQFEFAPTSAAITFYKAFFGDKSDCIQGAINVMRAKFFSPIKMQVRDFLKQMSKEEWSIDAAVERFTKANFTSIVREQNKTAFDTLFLSIFAADEKAPVTQTLLRNVAVIRSQLEGKDISAYMHSEPERPTVNNVLHASIYGKSFRESFGSVA